MSWFNKQKVAKKQPRFQRGDLVRYSLDGKTSIGVISDITTRPEDIDNQYMGFHYYIKDCMSGKATLYYDSWLYAVTMADLYEEILKIKDELLERRGGCQGDV